MVHQAARRFLTSPYRSRNRDPGAKAYAVRTTASVSTTAYKEQVRSAVVDAAAVPAGPVQLQLSFVVGPQRNWLTLWKPTIDALDPLFGRTRAGRDCHPQDGRITDLGLHVAVDATLCHDALISIAAAPAAVSYTRAGRVW